MVVVMIPSDIGVHPMKEFEAVWVRMKWRERSMDTEVRGECAWRGAGAGVGKSEICQFVN